MLSYSDRLRCCPSWQEASSLAALANPLVAGSGGLLWFVRRWAVPACTRSAARARVRSTVLEGDGSAVPVRVRSYGL